MAEQVSVLIAMVLLPAFLVGAGLIMGLIQSFTAEP
jgi:hypothetical protein